MLLRRLQQARALVALPTTPPAPDTIPSNLADYPEFQFAVRTAELYNQLLHVLATEKVSLENEGKKIIDQLEALCTQYKHFVEKQDFSRNQKPFWKHWKIEKGLLSPTLSTITQNMTAYFEAFWLVGTVNLVCCRGPLPQTAVLDATTNTYFIGIPKDDVCEKILEQFFQKYRALYYDLFATINDMPTQRQERGTHHEPSHSSIN